VDENLEKNTLVNAQHLNLVEKPLQTHIMNQFLSKKGIAFIAISFLAISFSFGQGVTTATMSGSINGEDGTELPGAVIKAEHLPSGTVYSTVSNESGRFTLPNLRVGGPYTVSITYVGYEDSQTKDIQLSLGQNYRLSPKLVQSGNSLEEIIISGNADPILNGDRTGAATNISRTDLERLPSISRSASDFTRLTPSSAGNSFGGRNNQYNNFSLDGSIFNNPFGLDAATPGGQTDAQAVSLDAIEQIQVSEAPYDVTQAGFTGASINAVTKSGTNEFHGTAFYFTRNEDLTGSKVNGDDIFVGDLLQRQYGASIGGPIIKNKLFFFANYERDEREDLAQSFFPAANAGQIGEGNISRVLESDLMAVSNALSTLGYETGPYRDFIHNTPNDKAIVKLDWNLNEKHTITGTYNWLDASKEKPAHPSALGRRGPDATTLQFQNSGYRINNKINSGIIEWRGNFSNKISNKLQAGYTHFDDFRDALSAPAPVININQNGVRYIVAGQEPFSINNALDQKVYQISDNLNVFLNDHTLTIGSSFERFEFDNSFNLGAYDPFPFDFNLSTFGGGFASVQDFLDAVNDGRIGTAITNAQNTFNTNQSNDSWALAETNVGQLAFYVQDEWYAKENLKLTFGLRGDLPLYFDTAEKIQENIDRNCCYDPTVTYFDQEDNAILFDHTNLPEQKLLVSPRIGFNWDVKGDRTAQLRGGSGVFTGRFPFVWVGNQVANPNSFFYNITAQDFQFPQVWRTNVGFDKEWNSGVLTTMDVAYTKDINAMMVRNYGIRSPTATLTGVDNRPVYGASDKGANPAYVFTNTDEGNSVNISLQAQKAFTNGAFASVGYNFNESRDASSIPAEISSDAYDRNPSFGNSKTAVLSNSLYGNRHRVIGNFAKQFSYGEGKYATTIGLFAEYAQGGRYSFTYAGDINNDDGFNNDLIYVPTSAEIGQMSFAVPVQPGQPTEADQRTALESFIANDEYLSGKRGGYAEKYASLLPWYSTLDMKVTQDFNMESAKKVHTFQLNRRIKDGELKLEQRIDRMQRQHPMHTDR